MSKAFLSLSLAFFSCLISFNAWACTGIRLKAQDGSVVNGRTVEFGIPLNLGGLVIPRNHSFQGTLPDGSAGKSYKTKYAAIGGGMFGEQAIADGINEKGLAIGAFYFSGYAQYATLNSTNKNKALSPTEFSNWIITQFATIDEVKAALNSVVIAPTTPQGWPVLPAFHYVVYDQTGKSIAIEPIGGKLKVYDNPLGVFTNSPNFDWHLTNLANYTNLSPFNSPTLEVDNLKLEQFSQGSGLRGLPGDFTSPSRFVRAATFSVTALPTSNAQEAVFQTFHILNQFDIPLGSVREKTEKGAVYPESTIATIVRDTKNLKFYFRTYQDQNIKMVNLNEFDLNAPAIKTFAIGGIQTITDISNSVR